MSAVVVVEVLPLLVFVGHGMSLSGVSHDVVKQLLGAPGLRHGLVKLCCGRWYTVVSIVCEEMNEGYGVWRGCAHYDVVVGCGLALVDTTPGGLRQIMCPVKERRTPPQ